MPRAKMKTDGKKMVMLRTIFNHQKQYKVGYGVSCEGRPPFKDRVIQSLIGRGLLRYAREPRWSWRGGANNISLVYITEDGCKVLGVNYADTYYIKPKVCG